MSEIAINPVSGGVGVEVANVDIGQSLTDPQFQQIQQAFVDNGLVFLRDQSITPEQHIEVAERWG